jgi:hypothetical protein
LPYHKDTDKIMPLNMPYIKGQENAMCTYSNSAGPTTC